MWCDWKRFYVLYRENRKCTKRSGLSWFHCDGSRNVVLSSFKVFIRIDLIQCGLIPTASLSTKTIALGKNLVVTRASNKGGVRVRCPLDLDVLGLGERTSIDFLCCHLAADQQGESQLEKRNQNAL